ncbi:hypothetical protein [Clostridium botulinum]|uniref:Phage protein n=1 Tax=Clostridium botulinum TaxID=1491 RepID=A0A6G4H4T5_CLOBO|nr:hypothetical protein [Clostridium botulinum]MBY6842263.1 hypothetical protein [Clostridium botulinum]MBY6844506.1 hypothetical protein [Clostridium botulinum]NFH35946.1 hypothetical protein [Clostridium botulinum]NFU28499.1 hypothetical protein [Clostridium botulinum]NFV06963.1 hypothetical protein [Clostridium botulinum]
MQRGSLIIYDNTGKIFFNTGDAEGDVLPHTLPDGLPYIITKFGELNGKIAKGIDVTVTPHKLITEDIPHIETEEEKLKKELLKAQSEVVDLKYKEVLNNIK